MKTCHNIWQACLWIFRLCHSHHTFHPKFSHPAILTKPTRCRVAPGDNCSWLQWWVEYHPTSEFLHGHRALLEPWNKGTDSRTAAIAPRGTTKLCWQRNGLVDILVPKKSLKNLAEFWISHRIFNKHAISEIRWNQEIWVITNQNLGHSSPWVSKTRGILRKLIHLLDHNGNTPEMMQLAHVFLEDQSIWDMKEDVKRFDCCRYCLSLALRTRNWLFLQTMLKLWCGLAKL